MVEGTGKDISREPQICFIWETGKVGIILFDRIASLCGDTRKSTPDTSL